MTDLRRLHESASPFERALVSSWDSEQPSSAARLAALSIGGAAVGLEGAKFASAGAKAVAAAKPAASTAVVLKLTAASVVAAALAGGAVVAVMTPEGAAPAEVAPRASTVRSSEPRHASTALPSELGTAEPPLRPDFVPVTPASLPDAPLASSKPASRSVGTGDTPRDAPTRNDAPRGSDVAREIAKVDAARRALSGGHGDAAIAELDAYEAAFPSGVLGEEAAALRIEALIQTDGRETAQRAADRFHARWPTSAHTSRLRALGMTIP